MVHDSRRSVAARPLLWAGVAAVLLGLAFNLGLFFIPITEVIRNPELVPMPEALVGWWLVAVGIGLAGWALLRRSAR
ncbi:MAG TPA: hypothetical protein VIL37_17745 [Natronosporangium sp.]